jgi:GntR family transcriptional regulator, transcriptional repressor for pyruvate dehydrogenase complex
MDNISFQPIKIRRLSEMIESSIKDFIITGALKPGHKLPNEKEIATQFGVSSVTVREALRGLEAFGIIHKKRGRGGGIFVGLSDSENGLARNSPNLASAKYSARDIGEVRKILEPAIAGMAAANITAKELKTIDRHLKNCEERIRKTRFEYPDKTNLDIKERHLEFHRLIAAGTHNPVLSLILDQTEDFELALNKTQVYNKEHNLEVVRQHRDIYDSLARGDVESTAKLMLKHCEFVDSNDRASELLKRNSSYGKTK